MTDPTAPPPAPAGRVSRATILGSLLVLALLAGWLVARAHGVPDVAHLRAVVRGAGIWAPVVFVAVYSALALLPVPKNVLTALGASLFGLAGGALLSWAAALAGACLAFAVGRALGRDAVNRLVRGRLGQVDATLRGHGVTAVLLARLVPILPFTAINYGSGVSAVAFSHYLLGSAVGMIPGTIAYAVLGAYSGTNPWAVGAAAAALVLLVVRGGTLARRAAAARPSPPGDRPDGTAGGSTDA